MSAASLILTGRLIRFEKSFWLRLTVALLVCPVISIVAFPWLPSAIMNYGEVSAFTTILYFLLHSVIFQLKIPLLILFVSYYRKYRFRVSAWILLPALAAVLDYFTPQVFHYYWGNSTGDSTIISQLASLGGVYLLSAVVLFEALLLMGLIRFAFRKGHRPSRLKRLTVPAGIYAFLLVTGLVLRSTGLPAAGEAVPSYNIALIQTGEVAKTGDPLRDNEKRYTQLKLQNFTEAGLAAVERSEGMLDLLIFPESAVPYHSIDPDTTNYSKTFDSAARGLARLAGADILINELHESETIHNTATLIKADSLNLQSRYKQILLPFGEYLPFEDEFPVLRELFPGAGRYSPGNEGSLLTVHRYKNSEKYTLQDFAGWLNEPDSIPRNTGILRADHQPVRIGVLICYEDMAAMPVRSLFASEPDLLINLTNDSHLGSSLANFQHAHSARLRAVESGLTLVRVTLTGPSAVYDPRGDLLIQTGSVGEKELEMISLPVWKRETLYNLTGNLPVILAGVLVILFSFVSLIRWGTGPFGRNRKKALLH